MALTQQRKDEITADMTTYAADKGEFHTFNVMTLAWAYNCGSNEITPLVRKWLKDGLIAKAYTGGMNTMNYRFNRGVFASLLEAASTDPVAMAAAIDYLLERGGASDRRSAEIKIKDMTRGK